MHIDVHGYFVLNYIYDKVQWIFLNFRYYLYIISKLAWRHSVIDLYHNNRNTSYLHHDIWRTDSVFSVDLNTGIFTAEKPPLSLGPYPVKALFLQGSATYQGWYFRC